MLADDGITYEYKLVQQRRNPVSMRIFRRRKVEDHRCILKANKDAIKIYLGFHSATANKCLASPTANLPTPFSKVYCQIAT
jgi:hypothetical protein